VSKQPLSENYVKWRKVIYALAAYLFFALGTLAEVGATVGFLVLDRDPGTLIVHGMVLLAIGVVYGLRLESMLENKQIMDRLDGGWRRVE